MGTHVHEECRAETERQDEQEEAKTRLKADVTLLTIMAPISRLQNYIRDLIMRGGPASRASLIELYKKGNGPDGQTFDPNLLLKQIRGQVNEILKKENKEGWSSIEELKGQQRDIYIWTEEQLPNGGTRFENKPIADPAPE